MTLRPIQSSFTAGELSPKMLGQVDLTQYGYGSELMENFIVWPQGMISRRPGTRFISEGKVASYYFGDKYFAEGYFQSSTSSAIRLFPFQFSIEQAYIVEAGHFYFRFYMDQGQILSGTPSAPYELSHTYTPTELFEINYCQSADIMFLAHKDHAPAILSRTAHDAWTIADIVFTDQPSSWVAGNYPTVVGFYENRLFWAATPDEPHTMWGSKTGDYYVHTAGSTDADPIVVALNSDYVNAIKWISGGKVLLVGTSRGQWHISATGTNEALTSSTIKAAQETGLTSSSVWARCDHTVLFWQAFGRNLMEVSYSLESDSYVATPLTVLAEHIGRSPIKEMVYLQEPLGSVWCVRQDGQMAVLTYERQHKVVAWSRLVTDGSFESVALIPGTDRDEVWVLVKRTVGGVTVRYIELFESLETYENDTEDMFYVDSGLTYDGASATTFTGLSHLEGEIVSILADGVVKADKAVVSGEIILDRAAEKVQSGLPFTSTVSPVRVEMKYQNGGTIQDRRQRVVTLGVRFYRSYGGMFGEALDSLEIIPSKTMGEPTDVPIAMFTGDKRLQFPGSYNREGRIYLVQSMPVPMNLLALMPKIDIQ